MKTVTIASYYYLINYLVSHFDIKYKSGKKWREME